MAEITQDAASLRYCPASETEWDTLLDGTGIASPSSIWLCSETSGSLADSGSGGRTITITGTPTYNYTPSGWSRPGIKATNASSDQADCTISDVSTTSGLLLQMFAFDQADLTGAYGIGSIGTATGEGVLMFANGKLVAQSGANYDYGTQVHTGTLVLVTKLDRSRTELAMYTQGEKLAPTWSAPSSDTTMTLFGYGGPAHPMTMVYAAYWSGTDAEMSDAEVQTLLDALEGNMTTRQKMSAGSMTYKTVVAIEGYDKLISDAPSASVLDAWYGTDWSSVLGGLFVNIQNQQSIGRDSPFTTSGRCTLRIVDETGSDTLGTAVHRRLSGAETPITATVDRNDTTINVKATTNFASSGTAYIGTEAISYTGTTATTLTGVTRGKYSPFGCHSSGSGGLRFGGHHRVGDDINHVQMQPLVTAQPRVWAGKRVGIWMHTWDDANQTLNHRDEAELVYAGRIVQIGDDANSPSTVIELEHINKDLQNSVIGKDLWKATVASGIDLIAGKVFKFSDFINGSARMAANDLTVVSGTPASINEIKAGYYEATELLSHFSGWLASEYDNARINGRYNFQALVSNNTDIRNRVTWRIDDATNVRCTFQLEMPGEVAMFLGIVSGETGTLQQNMVWGDESETNQTKSSDGQFAPYTTLIFKPGGPGRLAQEFSDATTYEAENESGEFVDNYAYLPAVIKGSCDSSVEWGVFLLDEKYLMVGSLASGVLSSCWLAPLPVSGDNTQDASVYIGRRVDEPERGPVTLRQVLMLEDKWSSAVKALFYSTGVSGYNHSTYDTLSYGLGVGMPGELLGDEFERFLDNMPGADIPVCIVLDEQTKLSDLLAGDFLLRRSFVRFKNGRFEVVQWRTPTSGAAIAALTESTKASADPNPNFRCASVITHDLARPAIKFDYSREWAVGRSENYQRSFGVEDQTQVDDLGGAVSLQTIKLRNTFAGTAGVGAGLDALLAEYVAVMPLFRPAQAIERSLDQRYFLELAPGDIVTVTDSFARDPITGARGISARPAMVTSTSYSLGGFTAGGGKDFQSGRVTLNFLDVQRNETFAPCAQVNETVSTGGFDAGYSSGAVSLRCHANKFGTSGLAYLLDKRRVIVNQDADASYFSAGDKILIIEIDPADPSSPTYWERTIDSISGNDIVLTAALSSPAWDNTLLYRIVPQKWSQVTAAQQAAAAYQADDADHMIENDEVPFHYAASDEQATYHPKTGSERGEYVPQLSYGDGRPYDVGHERALIDTINTYIDRKSAHQGAFLWSQTAVADLAGDTTNWATLFAGPIYLGRDIQSNRVTRTLTVAPFWRSRDGSNAYIRVKIGRHKPQESIFGAWTTDSNLSFFNASFPGEFSVTSQWTTTSTTWATAADKTLDVGVKDIDDGIAWLIIEGNGEAECRGLGKCLEGVRVVG